MDKKNTNGLFRFKLCRNAISKRLTGLLMLSLIALSAVAQNITVSGVVLDDKNESIIGATIRIKGDNANGTITDLDGNFKLTNVPPKAILSISYVGYAPQEIPIKGQDLIRIILVEDSKQLNELVVVGYGVQRKSDLTGAVASVKAEDALRTMPSANMTDALQGRLAGVQIVSGSGAPGSGGNTIRIRGVNSISGDGGPLTVIDGFIGGDISSVNPSDIQSVEVLKDASATAVYGSRGANGVILVTTRQAKKGTTRVSYNGYVNMKTPAKLPTQLSVADNARLQNSYMEEIYGMPPYTVGRYFSDDEIAAFERGEGGYDYLKATFKDVAVQHMHELSISGSSDKTKYLISGSFNQDKGIVHNSTATQANYRMKIDTEIRKWWKVGATLWGYYKESQGPSFGQNLNVLNRALSFPRFLEAKNPDGTYNDLSREPNPMRKIYELKSDGYSYTSYLQAYTDFQIMDGLNFRSSISLNLGNNNAQSAGTTESYNAHPSQQGYTSASTTDKNSFGMTNINTLTYIKEFNRDHRINANLVFEQTYGTSYENKITVRDIFDDKIAYDNLTMARLINSPTSERETNTMMSGLARINYVFKNRYMFTGSFRYDGSSRLAVGKQWYGFPSLSLAWDVAKEDFMSQVNWIDQAKVRFGYGVTGNQAVPAYSAYSQLSASADDKGNLSFAGTKRANPNLRWESTSAYNVGIDLGFMNSRFTASVELYDKLSNDVILEVPLPASTGFTSELINAATINNRGIEVTLGADIIDTKEFNWHTDVTFTHNVGRIQRIDGIKTWMEVDGGYESSAYRYIVGEKIGTMWGLVSDGIWGTDLTGAPSGTKPGDYRYKDLNKDGKITPEGDRQIIGSGQPAFNWGWSNTFTYKGFDLSLFFIGFHGFDIYNNNQWINTIDSRVAPNPQWLNRWTPANQNTNIPSFQGVSKGLASQFVEKGDFIKLKTVTLGYNFNMPWMKAASIYNLRLFASVQNPFVITQYSGIDPEVTLKGTLTPGADWGYYPHGRDYLIGLNITF